MTSTFVRASLFVLLGVVAACQREAPPAEPAPSVQAPAPMPGESADADTRAFVVELAEGQGPEALERAVSPPERLVSSAPLFPTARDGDDPFGLARIHRVEIAGIDASVSDWDAAYRIAERGGYATVEPDRDDTLLPEFGRTAACFDDTALPGADQPVWSLLDMKVDAARARTPPAGGRQMGEGVRICHPDSGWTHHVDLDNASLDRTGGIDLIDHDGDAFDPLGYGGNPGHGTATGSVLISGGGIGTAGTTAPGVVSGLAPKATLVPIRALRSVVQVLDSDIARAVRHSVDAQCDVISMSLGGRAFFGLKRAIRDAAARDVVVVAAAGNCVGFVVAPAVYDASIAVAASNIQHKPWKGSSHGRAVDIAAPGEDIHVADAVTGMTPGTRTRRAEGTSFATTAVAGAAADWIAFHGEPAIRDAQPAGTTRSELFLAALQDSAIRPTGWDASQYGAGILDVDALLAWPLSSPRTVPQRSDDAPDEVLARMFGRDPAAMRNALSDLLGQPADLDAELRKLGGELLDVAARDPRAFTTLLDNATPGGPRSAERTAARNALEGEMSRALAARIQP